MAGHSKWSNIKHRKAKMDAQKGKIYTRFSKLIIVAVREGGPDPNANSRLKDIIEKDVYKRQVVDGYYQYSPVLDGQINLTPDETARRAVMDALSGTDPTGGATTFFNPSKTNDQWVRSRPYITTIGSHVFSK